ncbi:MAG: FkbM family methyltransferase [Anaerolineaceae bacterium]|nr:FkbM family methyltransferase [Anaerolineaceae bacterium]
MAYYKNPITRYILRKNVLRRVKGRYKHYQRLLTKDALTDIAFLEQGRVVNTIFDVGANIGFMTYQLQRRFANAEIYAFEPNPYVFDKLESNYRKQNQVHVFQMGVGDIDGDLKFNINSNTGTSSYLLPGEYHRAHQAKHIKEQKLIPMVTIDKFCAQESIKHIDILKLDIEGYELRAIIGANEFISNQEIDIIYTEVNLIPSYSGQPLFHEITQFLENRHYHIYNVDTFVGQETPIRQAVIGNATYISSRFRRILEEKFGKQNCGW